MSDSLSFYVWEEYPPKKIERMEKALFDMKVSLSEQDEERKKLTARISDLELLMTNNGNSVWGILRQELDEKVVELSILNGKMNKMRKKISELISKLDRVAKLRESIK